MYMRLQLTSEITLDNVVNVTLKGIHLHRSHKYVTNLGRVAF